MLVESCSVQCLGHTEQHLLFIWHLTRHPVFLFAEFCNPAIQRKGQAWESFRHGVLRWYLQIICSSDTVILGQFFFDKSIGVIIKREMERKNHCPSPVSTKILWIKIVTQVIMLFFLIIFLCMVIVITLSVSNNYNVNVFAH